MKNLDRVTLIIVDTLRHGRALHSLKMSLSQIKPAKALFFTNIDIDCGEEIEVVKIDQIKSRSFLQLW